jgi:hypothetical protein
MTNLDSKKKDDELLGEGLKDAAEEGFSVDVLRNISLLFLGGPFLHLVLPHLSCSPFSTMTS